ncbi:hypothetical protein QTH87_05205 [Variovorax sp. J22P168]|uniref:hypothetical protein n=1 Tax=Variovorax jilinensis TaxID=3053513 RepID=UPI002576DAE5|nr:hypothetical protein [Variovorax sp. J22P168]MDM0011832.1 hypothetical protein [Variovorax sp. J22P168]
MEHLNFSGRREVDTDGLFGMRRLRLPPEQQAGSSVSTAARERPPSPLTPAEMAQVAQAWRRRADGSSLRVAEVLEDLAARRAPEPVPTPVARRPKTVVQRISEFMGL